MKKERKERVSSVGGVMARALDIRMPLLERYNKDSTLKKKESGRDAPVAH